MILYSASTEKAPPPDAGKFVRWGIAGIIAIVIFAIVGNQAVTLWMNVGEFDEMFTKPLFYTLVSSVILASIALIRINIAKRSSIFWYGISTAISFLNRSSHDPVAKNIQSYREYKLSPPQFVIWHWCKSLGSAI